MMLRAFIVAVICLRVAAQEDERLVARWSSSNGSDAAGVLDASGYNRHATVTSGVMTARGFSFRGTQVLTSASALVTTTANFTVSFWVNPTNVTTYSAPFYLEANEASVTPYVSFGALTNTTPYLDIRNSDGFNSFAASSNNIRDGMYHHISVVSTGSTFRLYIDGTFAVSVTNNKAKIPVTQADVGRLYRSKVWSNPSFALFEDLRIYNAALSDAELIELRSAGPQP
jgi:arabinan endo-1,5-alpha-L-arabinosidase